MSIRVEEEEGNAYIFAIEKGNVENDGKLEQLKRRGFPKRGGREMK